jgi:hypothetical protein
MPPDLDEFGQEKGEGDADNELEPEDPGEATEVAPAEPRDAEPEEADRTPGEAEADEDDLADGSAVGQEEPAYAADGPVSDHWEDYLPPPVHVSAFAKFRAVTFLALGPLISGYVGIAVLLGVVTGIASNARYTTTGVLSAALPSWLAAHQVPVQIFGLELGVLPLLPTIGVALLTTKAAARAAERLDLRRPGQAVPIVSTVAIAHAIAGVIVAGLSTDAAVTADPLAALYYPAFVGALAATLGVARRCGIYHGIRRRADFVAVEGLRAGLFGVVLLLTAGGAILTFGLLTSISTAKGLFPMGIGNAAGMLLLSISYLPNAMIAATSFAAGPGFTLGTVIVSPLEFHGGRLPGVPLLAALPEEQATWWPVLFVVPLAIGIAVGRRLRHVDEDPVARLRAVAIATGVVAVCFAVLAGTAGGRLGRGTFDPVSMRAVALSIALVLWTVVPGAIAAWFGGPREAAEPMPGLIEPDDEEPEDQPVKSGIQPEVPGPRDAVEESGEVARD